MRRKMKPKLSLSLLLIGLALPAQAQTQPLPTGGIPGLGGAVEMRGIPLNSGRLVGLRQDWIQNQYKLYIQTVNSLNRVLKRTPLSPADRSLALQLFNRQGLYYGFLESLGGAGTPTDRVILAQMSQVGLNWESWQAQVLELAQYLAGGSGWIIWEYNLLSNRTEIYPAQDETDLKLGSVPLLVLNLNHSDYADANGEDVAEYTRRLLANLRWDSAVARLDRLGIR